MDPPGGLAFPASAAPPWAVDAVKRRRRLRACLRAAVLWPRRARRRAAPWRPAAVGLGYRILPSALRYRYGYREEVFTEGDWPEKASYHRRRIRDGDMGAAILYALGVGDYGRAMEILGGAPEGADCVAQAGAMLRSAARIPRHVVDVGCGRGELAATFAHMGIRATAIDPAGCAEGMVRRTHRDFYGIGEFDFINRGAADGLKEVRARGRPYPDTVVFCESMEHVPERELWRAYRLARLMLGESGGVLVITNFIDYHPIACPWREVANWQHCTTIDDGVYDRMAAGARRTVFRRGSHMVLQF